MEIIVLAAVALVGVFVAFFIAMGALVLLPVTVGVAIVGWLIAGSMGALAGVVLVGGAGWFLIHNNS
jgi:nicotinamide mononucleotide (NMN) deamidase PncC